MSGGGIDGPPPSPPNGGEFLLSLLQKTNHPHSQPQQFSRPTPPTLPPQHQQQTLAAVDPAVAAFGPTVPFFPPWHQSNSAHNLPLPSHSPHSLSPPFPHSFVGLHPGTSAHQFAGNNFLGGQFPGNHGGFNSDVRISALSEIDGRDKGSIHDLVQLNHPEHKLMFGSLPCKIQSPERLLVRSSLDNSRLGGVNERDMANISHNGMGKIIPHSSLNSAAYGRGNYDQHEHEHIGGDGWGSQNRQGSNYRSTSSLESRQPPPGFSSKPRGGNIWEIRDRSKGLNRNVEKEKAYNFNVSNRNVTRSDNDQVRKFITGHGKMRGDMLAESRLSGQLDSPGLPAGSSLYSVSASEIEDSLQNLHSANDGVKSQECDKTMKEGGPLDDRVRHQVEHLGEELVESLLLEDDPHDKSQTMQHQKFRDKNFRSDNRGQLLLSQRMRNFKRVNDCRSDINRWNAPFLAIYESLIPAEEEKAKQKQLLTFLEKLVNKEWPEARLFLYGSCGNSFGVSKSDIDVCLAIGDADIDKSEILLKLAEILQSDNLQNVQALTRARVPIVKLMDPLTGISCDICINNVLAVVNTKLLRDYAHIDPRLRQLAFIVKHWAKSRGVNETYQGTLSSYAYVLMCINFLQQRRPGILPCLQEMETTYKVTVDNVDCAYFDQVDRLQNFGSNNKETIAQLVWSFFSYWAYRHDYANSVISVRSGSIISKRAKDWTRRIGNDRHLICIEDPFETSHDLGRVVDKNSIRVLREEFERAADIMQYDPNPCLALFQPYVPN